MVNVGDTVELKAIQGRRFEVVGVLWVRTDSKDEGNPFVSIIQEWGGVLWKATVQADMVLKVEDETG